MEMRLCVCVCEGMGEGIGGFMYCHELSSEKVLSPLEAKDQSSVMEWSVYFVSNLGLTILFKN